MADNPETELKDMKEQRQQLFNKMAENQQALGEAKKAGDTRKAAVLNNQFKHQREKYQELDGKIKEKEKQLAAKKVGTSGGGTADEGKDQTRGVGTGDKKNENDNKDKTEATDKEKKEKEDANRKQMMIRAQQERRQR